MRLQLKPIQHGPQDAERPGEHKVRCHDYERGILCSGPCRLDCLSFFCGGNLSGQRYFDRLFFQEGAAIFCLEFAQVELDEDAVPDLTLRDL